MLLTFVYEYTIFCHDLNFTFVRSILPQSEQRFSVVIFHSPQNTQRL